MLNRLFTITFNSEDEMNKKNKRKNAPRAYQGYLTAKERKIVEWYEQKRIASKLKDLDVSS